MKKKFIMAYLFVGLRYAFLYRKWAPQHFDYSKEFRFQLLIETIGVMLTWPLRPYFKIRKTLGLDGRKEKTNANA